MAGGCDGVSGLPLQTVHLTATAGLSRLPMDFPPTREQLDLELERLGFRVADFLPFDANTPLDVSARIRATPSDVLTKGMFLEHLARSARKLGVPCEGRYVAFRDYPLRELMQLIADYGAARHRGLPTREALRRVGWEAFPTIMSSILGRVLFTFAGKDLVAALRLAPEAYKRTLSSGSVRTHLAGPRQAVLEFRGIWNFPDTYQVGAIEGGCRAFDANPTIGMRVHSDSDVDMLIRW